MFTNILAQAAGNFGGNTFLGQVILYVVVGYALFFLHLYIFRSVFNIPSILRYHRAQIKLLEAMAKQQGVDDKTVKTIISESVDWSSASGQTAPQKEPAQ